MPRAVHVVEEPVWELLELVRARQWVEGKRIALIITIRGYAFSVMIRKATSLR
ncbi:MAG: hypothetical protein L0H94_01465 [Nitrospira sp.]|nr:hypothetical protein [Nitrospira sp.]